MQDLAFEQPGDRVQARMRMGPDVDAGCLCHAGGAHVIRETPGAHRAPLAPGQRSPHAHRADHRLARRRELHRGWRDTAGLSRTKWGIDRADGSAHAGQSVTLSVAGVALWHAIRSCRKCMVNTDLPELWEWAEYY